MEEPEVGLKNDLPLSPLAISASTSQAEIESTRRQCDSSNEQPATSGGCSKSSPAFLASPSKEEDHEFQDALDEQPRTSKGTSETFSNNAENHEFQDALDEQPRTSKGTSETFSNNVENHEFQDALDEQPRTSKGTSETFSNNAEIHEVLGEVSSTFNRESHMPDPTEECGALAHDNDSTDIDSFPGTESMCMSQISFVRTSFPGPRICYGEDSDDDETTFLMFAEQPRVKFEFEKQMYNNEKSKILYAMSSLGPTPRKLIADQWDPDQRKFQDVETLEDLIRIIREHAQSPEEYYRVLMNSKRELERTLQKLKQRISTEKVAHDVALQSWTQFKERLDQQPVSAIELLIGKPKFYWQRDFGGETRPLNTEDLRRSSDPDLQPWLNKWQEGREIPERIRINSAHLIQVLKKIPDGEWTGSEFEDSLDDEAQSSIVFTRPYKFLYHFHSEIEAQERDLEKRLSKSQLHEKGSPSQQNGQDGSEIKVEGTMSARLENTEDMERALRHLQILVSFTRSAIVPTANKLRLRATAYDAPTRVDFRDLWYLFQPGDEVYMTEDLPGKNSREEGSTVQRDLNKPSAWRVLNVANSRPRLSPPVQAFELRLYNFDYSGIYPAFGPTWRRVQIHHYEGEKEITSLRVVPLRFAKDSTHERRFTDIGKKFLQLTRNNYVHQQYSGPTLTWSPTGFEYEDASNITLVREQVMVDFQDGAKEKWGWTPILGLPEPEEALEEMLTEAWPIKTWRQKEDKTWESTIRPDNIYDDTHVDQALLRNHEEKNKILDQFKKYCEWQSNENRLTLANLNEEDMKLLPNRVCAFRLSTQEYVNITVEGLEDLPESSDSWDEIVLNDTNTQSLLEALVKSHRAKKQNMDATNREPHTKPGHDLVAGKGEGLVILLHGRPGVGKTSTVECLSESLKIPLLPMSCGALVNEPDWIEHDLRRLFRKAERWNCLILFDEADVVLVERDRHQMEQNEICSIFLRELEYCQGVIFLTTNRAGHIDEAVKSRVHLAVYYPSPSESSLKSIWRNNLKRLKRMSDDRRRISFETKKQQINENALDFIKTHDLVEVCNGRVIRNICHVALSLAEADASQGGLVRLGWKQFHTALDTWKNFEDYMKRTKGQSDSDRAKEHGIRHDNPS